MTAWHDSLLLALSALLELQALAQRLPCAVQLELLAQDGAAREAYLEPRHLIDILQEFLPPGARVAAQELLAALRPLIPRLYSISSSPLEHPARVQVPRLGRATPHATAVAPVHEQAWCDLLGAPSRSVWPARATSIGPAICMRTPRLLPYAGLQLVSTQGLRAGHGGCCALHIAAAGARGGGIQLPGDGGSRCTSVQHGPLFTCHC